MTTQEWDSINTLTTHALIKLMVKKVKILSTDVSIKILLLKTCENEATMGKTKEYLKT